MQQFCEPLHFWMKWIQSSMTGNPTSTTISARRILTSRLFVNSQQPTVNQSINQTVNQSINQSDSQSVNQSDSQSVNQQINNPILFVLLFSFHLFAVACIINSFTILSINIGYYCTS